MKIVALMLKTIYSQESRKKVEDGIEETLTYMDFPARHWTRIRSNNTIERLNCEIKGGTKAIVEYFNARMCQTALCSSD